ncbi:MAG: ribosomal protein methyltransferase [Segetibacter sp.]|nr:ribosomal protein methyltransferase [Segetibacter sp.]
MSTSTSIIPTFEEIMNDTVQISIAVTDEQTRQQLIAQLSINDFDAFEENDENLIGFINSENFDEPLLQSILARYNLSYTRTTIKEQNWNALWESNFQPVVVDDFCAIRADFHEPFLDKKHEIIITPKMSFGTGHHATTYMMISEMSKIDFKNKRVADFGTGTGVLAILAEKLGGQSVWAIDIDDWSIENATENIVKNGCTKVVIEKADSFDCEQSFDVVLANINRNVIQSNADFIVTSVGAGGKVLLSGLLKEDENEIVTAFEEKGFEHISTVERNNWICLLLQFEAKSK